MCQGIFLFLKQQTGFVNFEDVGLKLKWFFHKHIQGFGFERIEVLKTKGYQQSLCVLQKGVGNTKTKIEGLGLKLHLN